jgi:SAM-dependent methyltransferase
MSLSKNLVRMEQAREVYWRRYPGSSPVKLRWRAITVRHCFHVLPGESILEVGAGSGLWTEHLTGVLRGENSITAAVFNASLAQEIRARALPNVSVALISDLSELPPESFDYVVGTAILCHSEYARNLQAIYRLLKPGGQLFFFEANYWNPQVFVKCTIPAVGRWAGHANCQVGMRKYKLMQVASQQGYCGIHIVPYDIVHPVISRRLLNLVNSLAFFFEQTPVLRELCGTLYIWAKKPGDECSRRPKVKLTPHPGLKDSVSVVVPCHNEEMNVEPLARALLGAYDEYIHEIIFVNDASTDRTADLVRQLGAADARVRLVDRQAPNGVGLALRDGYAAASGRYILSMDCDFADIVPEFRDLFEAVAAGFDGAIGSRFSHESVLINYPFAKIFCNRFFHLLMRVMLRVNVRDVSNNLKLFRSEILKSIVLEEPHFAANVETGLKPVLAGYRIKEVPISWINRSLDMGRSSFSILKVASGYASALLRMASRKRGSRAVPRAATVR